MKKITIFYENENKVVSSRELAYNFEKEHKIILQEIENKIQQNQNTKRYFTESRFFDEQRRVGKEYLINRNGFLLIYPVLDNGSNIAILEDYMNHFTTQKVNDAEVSVVENSTPPVLFNKIVDFEKRIIFLEDNIILNSSMKKKLRDTVRMRVMSILGGKGSLAYKKVSSKAFNEAWRYINNTFDVTSYSDIPRLGFDTAIKLAITWEPSEELSLMIRGANIPDILLQEAN